MQGIAVFCFFVALVVVEFDVNVFFFTAQTISFSESTARKMFPAPNGEKKQKKELAR